jgi:hypothetical protein
VGVTAERGAEELSSLKVMSCRFTIKSTFSPHQEVKMAVLTYQFSSDNTQQVGLFLRIVVPSIGAEVLETGVVRTIDNQVVFQAGTFDSSIDLCAALS